VTQGRGTGGPASEREQRLALTQLTVAYWRSGVLFAALRLGVFDAVAERPLAARAVAARCGAAPDHMTRLLNACVALQLLELADGEYRNAPMADRLLVSSSEQYLGDWVKFMADFYGAWGQLDGAVRSGRPVQDGVARLRAGEDYARHMMLATHEYAMGPGRELMSRVALAGRRRLLDVGGGAGSYSILLAQNHPELEAVVFDLPEVVGITREMVARYGLSDRITARAGNYHDDDLGTGFDAVLLSNMLHQEDPETCLRLLRKAATALVDGGTLIVQLAFLNRDRVGPPWAVLLSLQVLLAYQGGRMYTTDDIVAMLPEAGFDGAEVRRGSLVAAESLILATKAGGRKTSDQPAKGDR
jgi:predicted O-methyltransferase YrrM